MQVHFCLCLGEKEGVQQLCCLLSVAFLGRPGLTVRTIFHHGLFCHVQHYNMSRKAPAQTQHAALVFTVKFKWFGRRLFSYQLQAVWEVCLFGCAWPQHRLLKLPQFAAVIPQLNSPACKWHGEYINQCYKLSKKKPTRQAINIAEEHWITLFWSVGMESCYSPNLSAVWKEKVKLQQQNSMNSSSLRLLWRSTEAPQSNFCCRTWVRLTLSNGNASRRDLEQINKRNM